MTPCLRGAHKWAVVSSGKGQARSPHASTLTLNYSLQSREGLTAVVSLLDFLNSSWNWVCGGGAFSSLRVLNEHMPQGTVSKDHCPSDRSLWQRGSASSGPQARQLYAVRNFLVPPHGLLTELGTTVSTLHRPREVKRTFPLPPPELQSLQTFPHCI